MKISIVTASYNSVNTIEQTISSVLNQSYSNVEYIIIDGGSTDGTVDIIKKYDKYISYWISEKDEGIYNAFNKGIKVASGEYIQFLGSDDFLINDTVIENVVKELDSTVDILSTNIIMVDENYRIQKEYSNYAARFKSSFDGSMIPHPGMYVKVSIMKNMLFDENFRVVADYDFFLKCYYQHPEIVFKYIDLKTVFFSLGGVSSKINEAMKNENVVLFNRYHMQMKLDQEKKQGQLLVSIVAHAKKRFLYILEMIGLYKWFSLKFRDWTIHSCNNEFCRWCKANICEKN